MEHISYMNEFIKKTKPPLPFRYALMEEGRYLMEINRAEKMAAKANQRKLEAKDKVKIVAVLEKDSRDEKVTQARHQQLTQMAEELRELNHYLHLARNTKELVAQLKLQDIEIDRRVEKAKKDAQEVQVKFRAMEERKRQEELKAKQIAEQMRCDLKLQMEENEARRLKKKQSTLQEGIEMKERMRKLDEKYRQELQAARIEKQQLRKDTIEFLRQKIELKKQAKVDDTNLILLHYQMERERDAMQQAIVDARNQRIKRQMEISAKIGEKTWAINKAKEQSLINLIETFTVEHQNHCDLLYEKEQEAISEKQRLMQASMKMQMAERQGKKEHALMSTREQENKRLTQSHHNSEIDLLRKRMERERWENNRFLQAKALEREESRREDREAEQKGVFSVAATQLREQQDIEAVRVKTLQEQPIPVLRYLPSSLLYADYLPKPIAELVKEQRIRDPIPVFNIKRNLRHVKRMKFEGGDPVICCKTCSTSKPISNIF